MRGFPFSRMRTMTKIERRAGMFLSFEGMTSAWGGWRPTHRKENMLEKSLSPLYSRAVWRKRRSAHLVKNPFCAYWLKQAFFSAEKNAPPSLRCRWGLSPKDSLPSQYPLLRPGMFLKACGARSAWGGFRFSLESVFMHEKSRSPLYLRAVWRKRRKAHLVKNPFCAYCLNFEQKLGFF